MITYKSFKENIGVKSLKWGNCSKKEKKRADGTPYTSHRAMVIYDGVKLYSRNGLLTEQFEKMSDEELFVYSGTIEETGEPVLYLTDRTGLTGIIEK
jgi:hypothetical protein